MREIKFRGVCLKSKELVYGDLIHGVGVKSGGVYILPNRVNLAYVKHCDPLDGVQVDPESVGQYTGLKDKEGREIYEGDIIAHPEFYETPEMSHNPKKYVVVKFKDCAFRIYDVILSDEEKDNNDYFYVAGNIYENPELLTK